MTIYAYGKGEIVRKKYNLQYNNFNEPSCYLVLAVTNDNKIIVQTFYMKTLHGAKMVAEEEQKRDEELGIESTCIFIRR